MAGIFSALSAAFSLTETVVDMSDKNLSDKEKADYIRKVLKKTSLISTDGSITKLLGTYVIEPFIIVSKNAKESEIVDKIIEANVDLFASYYMQAFNILTGVNGMDVNIAVRLLGTDNAGVGSAAKEGILKYLSREDFQDEVSKLMNSNGFLSTEANHPYEYERELREEAREKREQERHELDKKLKMVNNARETAKFKRDQEKYNREQALIAKNNTSSTTMKINTPTIGSDDSLNKISDQPTYGLMQRNLEIIVSAESKTTMGGKTVDTGTSQIVIPVTIKALIVYAGTDSILNMLAPNSRDKRFGARLDEYRAGAITFKELMFAGDLIKQYKQNRLKDKEGLLKLTNERIVSANAKIIENGVVGFEKYYNMLILTNEDKILFNKHIGGDISNEKYKQMFMDQAHAIVTTILDDDYERANMLIKDIRGSVDIGYKSISKRKNKDLDISEILKAFAANKPPVF